MPALSSLGRGPSAQDFIRQERRSWTFIYVAALLFGTLLAGAAHLSSSEPFPLAASLYFFGAGLILVRPIVGVYAIVCLTLLADNVSAPWYPFVKGGSSPESILYVSDSLVFSPLEGYLVVTCLALLAHVALGRAVLRRPPLLAPLLVFLVFVGWGLAWGLARGGDKQVALWEARPFAALFLTYLLATNLLRRRSHYHTLGWIVVAAITVESVRTLIWYAGLGPGAQVDSLVEHSAAIHMNLLFVLVAAAWLFRAYGPARRTALVVILIPVVAVYLLSERRAAIFALLFGAIVLFVVLAARDRSRFWAVGSVVTLGAVLYLFAFWSATGPLGFPASALRSQLAPEVANATDVSADAYRDIENVNILATLRSDPLTGVGCGHKFQQPVPLPDISGFFIWWEYITHNAVLWIWLKTGFFGFVAMFYWLGRTSQLGLRAAINAGEASDAVLVTTVAAYVPMYLVYSYVDTSWDAQSLVLLSVAMATITGLGRAAADAPSRARSLAGGATGRAHEKRKVPN